MIVLFVNLKYRYLYKKEYENKQELLNLLIKIYHSPHTPILPLLIQGLITDRYEYYSYHIKYWFDNLGYKIIPHMGEYLKYPMYQPKNKNKNK